LKDRASFGLVKASASIMNGLSLGYRVSHHVLFHLAQPVML